jgi:hypothetical protein
LGGWFRSFNQYKAGGQGGDAQVWAELHRGEPALIDRKAGGTLSVPRAAVSIIGGIQPELLQATLGGEHLFDGIASRLLFVAPPERLKKWNEATINNKTRKMWTGRLDKLLALQPGEDGAPVDLPMTRAAKALWVKFYRDHAQRETQEYGPLRSALAKLEAVTARLALVVQLADDPQSTAVASRAMRAGIAIGLWFESQARRVYQGLEETKQQKDRRVAREWIANKGGKITPSEFARCGPSRLRQRASEVLNDLVAAGLARLSKPPGHRGRVYVLCDCDSSDGESH